jgi:hypothetical protein
MAKKKKASALTTDEVLNRLFGKGAAKKLRKIVAQADAEKGQKKRKKTDGD